MDDPDPGVTLVLILSALTTGPKCLNIAVSQSDRKSQSAGAGFSSLSHAQIVASRMPCNRRIGQHDRRIQGVDGCLALLGGRAHVQEQQSYVTHLVTDQTVDAGVVW